MTVLGFTLFCVALSVSPLASSAASRTTRGVGDVALYWREVARIRAGASYHDAAAAELRVLGYPTRSLFNWRTPLPMWLVAKLQIDLLAQAILASAALATLVLGYTVLDKEGQRWKSVGAVVLLIGAMLPCVLDGLFIMPVVWSGVLIALSLCVSAIEWRKAGAAVGIAALFFRELAGVYCAAMLVLAVARRRRGEVAVWLAGMVAYAVFFAWHASEVYRRIEHDAVAHQSGWIQFGGAAFVISTFQMNACLLVLPQWFSAVYFPLSMLGFAGWPGRAGERFGFAACAFVLVFAIVGHAFNQYWGSLLAPLACFGFAWAPASITDLLRASGWWPARVASDAIPVDADC